MEIYSSPKAYVFNLHTTSSSEARRLWRRKIKEKWNYQCAYCGSDIDLTIDHVVPRSKKGSSTWDNVVTACKVCNLNKGDKEVRPKIEPIKPSFSYLLKGHQINRKGFPDSEWEKYIFQS